MSKNPVTVVVGLGEIGKPLYNIISRIDARAVGVDIKPVSIDEPVELIHICYPFQLSDGFVRTTIEYIKKYKPQAVVVNSTVRPGTTDEIARQSGIPAVYSPVRGKHTRMESELLDYHKFLAGTSEEGAKKVERHFNHIGMKTRVISSTRVLELAKLLETTYFGLLIAWAQEMDRLARHVGGDYFEMAQFFEEISYLPPAVFKPGFIGGHCVMPNIALLESSFVSDFFDAIKNSNSKKAKEVESEQNLTERIEPVKISRLS